MRARECFRVALRGLDLIARTVAILGLLSVAASCSTGEGNAVTVYVALDRQLAEPVLVQFEQETGIKVNALYDSEANKTSGLVNRLIAEAGRPRADAFWNNETAQLVRLSDAGVLESGSLNETTFAGRLRVLIVHEGSADAPTSIDALTDPRWKGKAAIANPHFGSTGTHFAAVLAQSGEEAFREWLRALRANQVAVLTGNAQVKDAVAEGRYSFGLTDTDDVNEALRAGKPVRLVVPDQGAGQNGAFLIPNAVVKVRGGPNAKNAQKLIDYLLSAKVEAALAAGPGVQIPLRHDIPGPELLPPRSNLKLLAVDYEAVGRAYQRMLQIVDEEWPS